MNFNICNYMAKEIYMDKPTYKFMIRKYLLGHLVRLFSYMAYTCSVFISESSLKLDKPIFIIGCSRSGTTIFNEIFGKHRDVANWSEAAQIFDSKYYSLHGDDLKAEENVSYFDSYRLRLFFNIYVLIKRRKRFMNKHPQNSLRIRYLNSIFPDALFVHLIRDGRAVIFSNCERTLTDGFRKKYPFGKFPKPVEWQKYMQLPLMIQFAHQWVDITTYIRDTAIQILKPDRYIEIRYEDFCKNPRKILHELDLFCRLDPNIRNYEIVPSELRNYNFKWQTGLSEKEIEDVEEIIGDCMHEYGYKI